MPESFKRYRFSVPNADESVTKWIDAQSNLSHSIRELIKMAIRCNGYSDVSCYPVRQVVTGGYPIEYLMLLQSQGWGAPGAGQPGGQAPVQITPQASAPAPMPAPADPSGQGYPQTPAQAFPQSYPPGYPAGPAPGFAPGFAAAPPQSPAAPAVPANPPQQTFVSPEELLN